jgi:NADH-quinone oxidoreductase subunit J
MQLLVFICAAAMILVGAVGVIIRSHPVHAALSLILTLFGVAVMFVAQDAHFLAAVQVIVYAGAIVVLFLFVIMLLGVDRAESLRIDPVKVQRPLAIIVGVGLLGLIGGAIIQARDTIHARGEGLETASAATSHDSNIKQLASDLFSNRVFAFELTSVLLVIAVVGTVLLARRPGKSGASDPSGDVARSDDETKAGTK